MAVAVAMVIKHVDTSCSSKLKHLKLSKRNTLTKLGDANLKLSITRSPSHPLQTHSLTHSPTMERAPFSDEVYRRDGSPKIYFGK